MSKISDHAIRAICGPEPMREGEYPWEFTIGKMPFGDGRTVTKISFREDNYGDHTIGWFDVWAGDDLIVSMSARYVAEVHYETGRRP